MNDPYLIQYSKSLKSSDWVLIYLAAFAKDKPIKIHQINRAYKKWRAAYKAEYRHRLNSIFYTWRGSFYGFKPSQKKFIGNYGRYFNLISWSKDGIKINEKGIEVANKLFDFILEKKKIQFEDCIFRSKKKIDSRFEINSIGTFKTDCNVVLIPEWHKNNCYSLLTEKLVLEYYSKQTISKDKAFIYLGAISRSYYDFNNFSIPFKYKVIPKHHKYIALVMVDTTIFAIPFNENLIDLAGF